MSEERDPKVSAAYRGLGAEEPPRALDEAILAAARRDAGARPAPLVMGARRQRWLAPLAAAAVLVLAVAVTLNMQIEQPGIESPARQAPPPRADKPASVPASPAARAPTKLKDEVQPKFAAGSAAAPEPKPFAADQAAGSAAARSRESRGAEAPARLQAQKLADTPERELARIAEQRAQGRHDEADRALAEFRKRYPDYKIPSAMLERVERR